MATLAPSQAGTSERKGRRRRSSSLMYTEPAESLEHINDQAALPNLNAEWVHAKGSSQSLRVVVVGSKLITHGAGAWAIHFVIIAGLKIFFDINPLQVSQELSWTLTNITYMAGSYLMFHWVRGVPFEFNAGAYDNLNMWEQIDDGEQYTPTKKFLLSVPIILFLVSTHYTHYDFTYFTINLLATLAVVIPKLPAVSGLSFYFLRYSFTL